MMIRTQSRHFLTTCLALLVVTVSFARADQIPFGFIRAAQRLTAYWIGAIAVNSGGFTTNSGNLSGSGDGMMNNPSAVASDSSGNIYVAEFSNYRISKYTSAGAFVGWIGKIATSPTGGAGGCSGATIGTFTPGWCTGGTSVSGTGDGMMSSPYSVAFDLGGNLYVTDYFNHRINKYTSAGAFVGWIGKILTSPTGGAGGCNGATVGTFTPGWCTGGTSTSGTGDGMMQYPYGLAFDSGGNLYVADSNNHRINKYTSAGAFVGWIGKILTSPTGGAGGCNGATVGTFTPGWCTGGTSTSGTGDGMVNTPKRIAFDSGGNLFLADAANHRINKYTSAGVFAGWIGKINTSPTGGAGGCNGATVGTFTPGWCTGGTSTSGTGDGMFSFPLGVAFDSGGNLYAVDTNNRRINKYTSAGAVVGWIGKINTSPTGGAGGCNGATVGTFTPGWCTGGTSIAGSGDGMMNAPDGLSFDSGGNLYVADSGNNRINKYTTGGAFAGGLSTAPAFQTWTNSMASPLSATGDGMMSGPYAVAFDSSGNLYVADQGNNRINKYTTAGAFVGWIGKIATSPTGGAGGCNGATVGTSTPGWCTGGTSVSGTGDGMMNAPSGLAFDSSGNLYVADYGNHRINKYSTAGAFVGWIGKIATSPTGGAGGCNGATAGTFTPGWCTGGTSVSGTGDGMMNFPYSVAFDSGGNLYVADYNNHRINKYTSAGAFVGWIGKILTSPTGGAGGCNGAGVGTFTLGWCTGGTSNSGTGDGMMNGPSGVTFDPGGNFYVANYNTHRINKYTSTGAFVGWIGKINSSPTGGAGGCNGAAVGTFTPGWCTGGTATFGFGDGMMASPFSVALDSSGNFYVADSGNSRINKYTSTGAFVGWIGKINNSPTGGASGCNGATVGTLTPGWCTGGNSTSGTGDGMMSSPLTVAFDSIANLYVADSGNNRITRFK